MKDRLHEGPDGPAFRQWLRDNDPDAACMKREAAIVAARLDDVLSEPIHISPLEVLLLATFAEQSKADLLKNVNQIEEENQIAAEINRKVAERKELTRWWNKAIPLGRFIIGYLIACGLVALVVWLSVRQ